MVRYVNGQNQVVYEMSGGSNDDDIGTRNNSINGSLGTYRTEYIFNLSSIPSNATITSAKLQYSLSDWYATNYFAVCKLSGYLAYQALWDGIGSSPLLFYDLSYNGGETSSTQDLIDAVTSNIGGTLYLGAASQDEAHSTSYAKLNLTLNLIYTVPVQFVNITADNNFTDFEGTNHGTMVIDGTNRTIPPSGYPIQKTVDQNLILGAVSPQMDNQNHEMIWHNGSIAKSDWTRDGQPKSNNQTYSFTVTESDDGTTYEANLRKNYAITRIDATEFDGSSSAGVITHIVEQNSGQISAPPTKTAGGRNYNFAYWDVGGNPKENPLTISPNDNLTYKAFYKYPFHSSTETALTGNNQRKIIREYSGIYHAVYVSQGNLWYTRSTTSDFYGSWTPEELLYEGGVDLKARNPSMSYSQSHDALAIVFEYGDSDIFWNKEIKVIEKDLSNGSNIIHNVLNISGALNEGYPVVALKGYDMIVVYKGYHNEGIKIKRKMRLSGEQWTDWIEKTIPNTNSSSKNPSIVVSGGSSEYNLHIVCETGGRFIDYTKYHRNALEEFSYVQNSYNRISTGSGYYYNRNPLMSETSNGNLFVSWTVEPQLKSDLKILPKENTQSNLPRLVSRVKAASWGTFFCTGNDVVFTNNNTNSTANETVLAWCEDDGNDSKWVKRVNGNYTTAENLGSPGKDIQVSEGTSLQNMKAITFNPNTSSPYLLSKSATNFYPQSGGGGGVATKITAGLTVTYGRAGIVEKNGIEIVFNTGDVIVADSVINFIPRPDTIPIISATELNDYVKTNPFTLTQNTELYFSNIYFVVNKEIADSVLTENDQVSFKVELVNAVTEEVAGTFDDITYNINNLEKYDNINYQVNCTGLEEGEYYLRLITSVIGEADYSLANIQNDAENLEKKNYVQVNYDGTKGPLTYDLSQNYPNPFNPTTTINYQIPEDGFVTLKIYDILGREVKTLINEHKATGRYEVNFDASRLASGVYIYSIKVNDFVSSKKMVLLK